MKYLGAWILLNTLVVVCFVVLQTQVTDKRIAVFGALGLAIGAFLLLSDRITGFKVSGVAEITAAVERATADAVEIAALRKEMESRVAETAKELESIKQAAEFASVVTRAQNDDRAAFKRLIEIAQDQGHPYGRVAGEAMMAIVTDERLYDDGNVNWQDLNIDPANASTLQLIEVYNKTYANDRPRVLQAIWNSDKVSKFNKIQFMMSVIEGTDSVRVLRAACELVEQEAKIGDRMFDPLAYSKWWEKQSVAYPEWEKVRTYQLKQGHKAIIQPRPQP